MLTALMDVGDTNALSPQRQGFGEREKMHFYQEVNCTTHGDE
jgi:hypothetical protein